MGCCSQVPAALLMALASLGLMAAVEPKTPPLSAPPPASKVPQESLVPWLDPKVLDLLKDGKTCLGTAPPDFNGAHLSQTTFTVPGMENLRAFAAGWCTRTQDPFETRCTIAGPGGVSLKVSGVERIMYYVPPGFYARIKLSASSQECSMTSSHSRQGKMFAKITDAYEEKYMSNLYSVGVQALLRRDYANARIYLGVLRAPPDGAYLVGTIEDRGLSGRVNHPLAATWMYKSAVRGYFPAQQRLGEMYRDGVGVALDLKVAGYWLHQAQVNREKGRSDYDRIVETAASPDLKQ